LQEELLSVDTKSNQLDYLFGLFHNDHMNYHLEADAEREPTLLEMTAKAMDMLAAKGHRGYVLLVEGMGKLFPELLNLIEVFFWF
jgi:alkaline phosphatase